MEMRPPMFPKIVGRMRELGIIQKHLARRLLLSPEAVSQRLTGRTQWRLDEMYTVMDALGEPYENITEFFPDVRKNTSGKNRLRAI